MALISYLITMFAGLFWIIRLAITVLVSINIDIGFKLPDLTAEIIMLFVALFCLILIVRRNMLGAILYLISYGWYFGKDVLDTVMKVQEGVKLTSGQALNAFMAIIGVILAVATFADIAINKNRKGSTTNKKTDWFYKNKDFDREFDERADRNNYKF